MWEKPLQVFSDEYLEYCKQLSSEQIVTFLEQFRTIAGAGQQGESKLISMKVPVDLLEAFKFKAAASGRPYQTIIKELMRRWLMS
jgi:predicted DNA binding CopG/RHH family protein